MARLARGDKVNARAAFVGTRVFVYNEHETAALILARMRDVPDWPLWIATAAKN